MCADCMATRSECVLTEWLRGVTVCADCMATRSDSLC